MSSYHDYLIMVRACVVYLDITKTKEFWFENQMICVSLFQCCLIIDHVFKQGFQWGQAPCQLTVWVHDFVQLLLKG